mmetsp:Transcript_53958/g.87347  ORF Transcript_53958/g.87347 Transcript_53958/m.87347 type:complete len:289 (+) Transcript_53958:56-922(+)
MHACAMTPSLLGGNPNNSWSIYRLHTQRVEAGSGVIGRAIDIFRDFVRNRVCRKTLPEIVHKVALIIHQIKHNGVVYQVVICFLTETSLRKVDTELLASLHDDLRSSSHTNNARVPIGEIIFELFRAIAFGINCNEYGLDFVLSILPFVQYFQNLSHAHHFVGADVGTVRKPKINKHPLSTKILVASFPAKVVNQFKRPSDVGFAYCLALLCFLEALQTFCLGTLEVGNKPTTCTHQQPYTLPSHGTLPFTSPRSQCCHRPCPTLCALYRHRLQCRRSGSLRSDALRA